MNEETALRRVLNQELGLSHEQAVLRGLHSMERTLGACGFPPLSPFWKGTIERWYGAGRRQLVARVGRRGGKSSSLCRLAVAEALHGYHRVPPGDVGVVAIVSANRPDATARLKTICVILDALGVEYRSDGPDAIVLTDRAIGFRVYTASVAGVSGFTSIFVFCDEVAKWHDRDTGANPAREVLASIRPTMATQRHGRIVLSSSPMGMADAHFDAFEQGETSHQVVAHAESWVANPTITEEDTRADEPDELVWLREYAAVPQADSDASLIPQSAVLSMVRREPVELPHKDGSVYVATMDPATRGDAWTLVLCRRELDIRRVVLAREWHGTHERPLSPKAVLTEISGILRNYGVLKVFSDQFAGDALVDIGRDTGLYIELKPWSATSRREALEELRELVLAGMVEFPNDPAVIADVCAVKRILTRAGASYALPRVRDRHCDYAMALAMGVSAARWPGREELPRQSPAEEERQRKRDYLRGLEKQRRDEERLRQVGRPTR